MGNLLRKKTGIFEWINKGTGIIIDQNEPPILFHDIQPLTVKSFSKLEISFSKDPDHIEIASIQSNYGLEEEISHFESLYDNQYTFNNIPGKRTIIIRASFGKQEFHYTFPLIIDKTISYQHLLAEEKGRLAVLEIYDESQQQDTGPLKG